jgi:glucoamylase
MALMVPFIFLAYLFLYAFALSIPTVPNLFSIGRAQQQQVLQGPLDTWIQQQEKLALDKLLGNVAPGGQNVKDAAKGSVIASPSREHPNYFYQCERGEA